MPLERNYADLVAEARAEVTEVDADELSAMLSGPGEAPIVVDVREGCERRLGMIPGSVHISRGVLERDIEQRLFRGAARGSDLDRAIVLHCAGGSRSLLAALSLKRMGFRNVSSLRGGYKAWAASGRPIGVPRRPWEPEPRPAPVH